MCVFPRGDFAPAGSSPEAEVGADVEADCRERTDEHAVHVSGRPGNTDRILTLITIGNIP